MKKLFLSSVIFIILLASSYCQVDDKTITYDKRKLYQDGQRLNLKQVRTILAANTASAPEYEQFRKKYAVGNPLMLAGVGFIAAGVGIQFASSIKETNDLNNGYYRGDYPSGLGLIGVGVAVELIGVFFNVPAKKHFKQSIRNYNSNITKSGHNNVELNLYVNSDRLGIKMKF